jgi:hypothetical protein
VGNGGITPCILDVGTGWTWVVSYMLRSLYLRGKNPQYVLDRRLGRLQSLSGYGSEEKKSHHCTCRELNPVLPAVALSVYWLSCRGCIFRRTLRLNSWSRIPPENAPVTNEVKIFSALYGIVRLKTASTRDATGSHPKRVESNPLPYTQFLRPILTSSSHPRPWPQGLPSPRLVFLLFENAINNKSFIHGLQILSAVVAGQFCWLVSSVGGGGVAVCICNK